MGFSNVIKEVTSGSHLAGSKGRSWKLGKSHTTRKAKGREVLTLWKSSGSACTLFLAWKLFHTACTDCPFPRRARAPVPDPMSHLQQQEKAKVCAHPSHRPQLSTHQMCFSNSNLPTRDFFSLMNASSFYLNAKSLYYAFLFSPLKTSKLNTCSIWK